MVMRYFKTSSMQLRLMSAMVTSNDRMLLSLGLNLWKPTKSSRAKDTKLSHPLGTKSSELI